MHNKYRIGDRASNATRALETAWSMLIDLYHTIPHAVVTLLTAGDRRRKRGHLTHSAWQYRDDQRRHEIGISSDLFQNPEKLLCTMLHEAAHAILHKENGGCSFDKNHDYHLKIFRDTCRNLGLKCEFQDTRYGWTLTSWPDNKISDIYMPVLKHLKMELPKGTGKGMYFSRPARKLPKSGHIKLSCKCDKARVIYVNKFELKKGGIRCDLCGSNFLF